MKRQEQVPEEKDLYIKLVCDELKVSVEDVKSKCRDRDLCEARQITSYILLKHTKLTLYKVADFLNYVSHASPWRDEKQVPNLMEYNKDFNNKMGPVLLKARELAKRLKNEKAEKKKQEEYDRIFINLKEEDWYNNLFYSESLMLPV